MRLMVPLAKAANPKKMTMSKGKSTTPPVTQPHTHKVTRVASPSPEAVVKEVMRVLSPSPKAPNEAPSISGPSGSMRPLLFEVEAMCGDEEVMGWEAVATGTSSEFLLTLLLLAQLTSGF